MKDIYSYRKSLLAKTPSLKENELKEEGKKLYVEKLKRDGELLEAYNNKKLKSKTLIKKAKNIADNYNEKK